MKILTKNNKFQISSSKTYRSLENGDEEEELVTTKKTDLKWIHEEDDCDGEDEDDEDDEGVEVWLLRRDLNKCFCSVIITQFIPSYQIKLKNWLI